MNNARDYHKHEWGKIGPSYLLSENGDLSFLLCFSKQCLVEKFQGKFQKNSSVNLISEESPQYSEILHSENNNYADSANKIEIVVRVHYLSDSDY